jgi:hypothetical protein
MPEIKFTEEQEVEIQRRMQAQMVFQAFTENLKSFLHTSLARSRSSEDRVEVYNAGLAAYNNVDYLVLCLVNKSAPQQEKVSPEKDADTEPEEE